MGTILNLITNLEPAGAQTVLLDTLRRLDSGRHRLILGYLAGRAESLPRGSGLGTVRVIDFSCDGRFDPWVLPRIVRAIRREHVRIVHTHLVHAGIIGKAAARMCGVPSITTRHYGWDRKEGTVPYRLETRLTSGSTVVIAVSRAVERYLIEKRIAAPEKIAVIENGVDASLFDPALWGNAEEAEAEPTAQSPSNERFVIGCAGRLAHQKGHALLLSAFARIADRRPDAFLEIVGDGPLRRELEDSARAAGVAPRVCFTGRIPHDAVPRRIAGWDLCVMPSLWEGFGLAAAEAMAMERAVVASRVEGLADLVLDGVTGLLVPPRDPIALAEEVLSLMDDAPRRAEMGWRGRERIVRSFTADHAAARVGEIYDRVSGPR